MSTQSTIWIMDETAPIKFRGIYCHFDGYLDYNGRILFESYSDIKYLEELIALGDLSSLEDTPESSVAYGRDRGEDVEIFEFSDDYDFINCCKQYNYTYLFNKQEQKWYYSKDPGELSDFIPLEDDLDLDY